MKKAKLKSEKVESKKTINKKTGSKKLIEEKTTETNELKKLSYIFGLLIVLFVAFYGVAYFMDKNKTIKSDDEQKSTIQYDEILVGNILKQDPKKYYVLVYDNEEEFNQMYSAYISANTDEDAVKIYYSNLTNSINTIYKSTTSKLKVKKISDLKIKTTTLFEISSGKINKYYEGESAVLKQLKNIVK